MKYYMYVKTTFIARKKVEFFTPLKDNRLVRLCSVMEDKDFDTIS